MRKPNVTRELKPVSPPVTRVESATRRPSTEASRGRRSSQPGSPYTEYADLVGVDGKRSNEKQRPASASRQGNKMRKPNVTRELKPVSPPVTRVASATARLDWSSYPSWSSQSCNSILDKELRISCEQHFSSAQ